MTIPLDEKICKIIIWVIYFIGLYYILFWLSVLLFDKEKQEKDKKKENKQDEELPEITIIIPAWNEEDSIQKTIEKLYESNYPQEKLKVICVDNNSTDNTSKILKKLNKKYPFLHLFEKHQGKHNALNTALKHTKTPFFACLDADSFPEPNAIKLLVREFLKQDEKVAAILPVMKVYNPQNLLQRVQWIEYIINIFYKYISGKIDCIHVTPGPLSMYRTKIIKKLGGFKKAHNTEDLEIALRLQNNHYKIIQSLDAVVYTISPDKLKGFISQRERWYYGTMKNVYDYKHILMNKKYEEFGVFYLPMVAITGIITVIGIFTLLYLGIKNYYHLIKRAYLTHFDIITYIRNYHFDFNYLDLNWMTIITSYFLLAGTIITIYLSIKANQEKINIFRNIKYFIMFVYYFILYRFILSYIWLKVLLKIIKKETTNWIKVNNKIEKNK